MKVNYDPVLALAAFACTLWTLNSRSTDSTLWPYVLNDPSISRSMGSPWKYTMTLFWPWPRTTRSTWCPGTEIDRFWLIGLYKWLVQILFSSFHLIFALYTLCFPLFRPFLSFEQKLILNTYPRSTHRLTDWLTHPSVRIMLLNLDKGFLQIFKN